MNLRGFKAKDAPFSPIVGVYITARPLGSGVWYSGYEYDADGYILKHWDSVPDNWSVAGDGKPGRLPYLGDLSSAIMPCVFNIKLTGEEASKPSS